MPTSVPMDFVSRDTTEEQFRVEGPVFYTKETPQLPDSRVIQVFQGPSVVIFKHTLVLEHVRLAHLRRQRLIFGVAALLCLCALIVSLVLKIPYEPPAALFFSIAGIFVVFVMKVRDATR